MYGALPYMVYRICHSDETVNKGYRPGHERGEIKARTFTVVGAFFVLGVWTAQLPGLVHTCIERFPAELKR